MGVRKTAESRRATGTVSITNYKCGLRLRWRYRMLRPELYVSNTVSDYKRVAKALKSVVETDMLHDTYDITLAKYKDLLKMAALQDSIIEDQVVYVPPHIENTALVKGTKPFDMIAAFNLYLGAKGIKETDMPGYYYYTRQMLIRWGAVKPEVLAQCLSREAFSNRTFNDRRNCLGQFLEWCVRKGKIKENPLTEVVNRKREKAIERRKPFTDSESAAIVEALRSDSQSKSVGYKHSQYWRIVAFLLHCGTRNGEAIGLKVMDVNFEHLNIRIAHALSRTRKGTHINARVYKGTKMENVRYLPMDDYLCKLLWPICQHRVGEEYVFVNRNGNPIDDHMFQRRVFKPLLKALNIQQRDLYACRHTFATRAVRQGMKPHEVAYLMGDTVDTVLNNYFHNNTMPSSLPIGISSLFSKA